MKKIYLVLSIAFISSAVFFTSCNKDDDATPEDSHQDFTPEQHKDAMSTAANDAIAQLETLQDSKSIDAGESVSNLMNLSDPFAKTGTAKIQDLLKGIESFINNPSEKDELLKSLKAEENRFMYNDYVGEYSWNSGTQSWDKANSTKIIFKFPATESGTSNNAVFTFATYADVAVTIDGIVNYFPTAVSANLIVDGTKELELIFTASYKSDGMPKAIDLSLFINPFTFTLSIKNTDTVISEDFAWTLGNDNILSFGTSLNGDFSSIDYSGEVNIGDYISTASTYVQIFDVRLEGTANVTELAKLTDPTVEQVNANTTILLKWANDNVKIADGEFYEKTVDEVSVMLTFSDGTTADAEVFFETIIADFEDFFTSLEADLES